ncbi:hypothetical protein ONS95_009127 [Cadophora gregata]|uniref:uncharacterized protein n=1 Tax=Cadophora gregata TaxID=51156 RepID=UPI0026DB8B75|nr:uncharacterized protein ONS95_009127 [Cadophora gregata]KAK0124144.1 hypothetical protein ONS95_009127 [Cadophora gregata]KAK0130473.1 hypothetical protein ONS96_000992 [Cadophora gregata f. sp. sojae]
MEHVDKFDLTRFITAQERQYPRALSEIRRGRKTTHWIWYIFPSLIGISTSAKGNKYAISSLEEAQAYLQHPVLNSRLIEITQAVLNSSTASILKLMGSVVDVTKMHASMTLFLRTDPEKKVFDFQAVLNKYYDGSAHEKSDEILGAGIEDES